MNRLVVQDYNFLCKLLNLTTSLTISPAEKTQDLRILLCMTAKEGANMLNSHDIQNIISFRLAFFQFQVQSLAARHVFFFFQGAGCVCCYLTWLCVGEKQVRFCSEKIYEKASPSWCVFCSLICLAISVTKSLDACIYFIITCLLWKQTMRPHMMILITSLLFTSCSCISKHACFLR